MAVDYIVTHTNCIQTKHILVILLLLDPSDNMLMEWQNREAV